MQILQFIAWSTLIPAFITLNYLFNLISPDLRHYLFYLRVPLVAGLLICLFPLIATKVISALLRNIFVMSNKFQVALGIVAALLAGRSILIPINAIVENAHARFPVSAISNSQFPWDYGWSIVLGLPIILTIISETRIERQWWSQIAKEHKRKYAAEIIEEKDLRLGIAIGIFSGLAMFIADKCLLLLLETFRPAISNFLLTLLRSLFSFSNSDFDVQTNGYFDAKSNLLASGHLAGMSFFAIGGCLFFATGYCFRPQSDIETKVKSRKKSQLEAPVLIYIATLFALIVPLFATLTFSLDRFGIPVITTFLLFSGLSYWVWGVDHFFEFSDREKSKQIQRDEILQHPDDFKTAISARLDHQSPEQRTLVVVTASGGGIHAAGWTTQVLTGLQKLLGAEFTQAIGLISSVSGGSVGTMYFLDACRDDGYPKQHPADRQDLLDNIFQNAVQDGVDSVGWGLVYLDFWRFLGLPWLINLFFKNQDRGTSLEKNWQGSMNHHETTLNDWQCKIMKGEIPTPVFNATLVEDGRRLLVSPMTFAKSDTEQKIDSNTLYKQHGQRIKAVTAARLSATFPYVSPCARNPDIGIDRNYHIIDGGYFDNSGVVTAIEWLEDNMDTIIKDLKVKKLVFIEIEAGAAKIPPIKVPGKGGWLITLFGALSALFNVRDASLVVRNQQEIDLLVKDYRSKLDTSESAIDSNVQHLRIEFPNTSKFRCEPDGSEKTYSQPLSWKLTASQKYVLEEAWLGITLYHPKLKNLQRLWHKQWGFKTP
jgi:hypothetical protein